MYIFVVSVPWVAELGLTTLETVLLLKEETTIIRRWMSAVIMIHVGSSPFVSRSKSQKFKASIGYIDRFFFKRERERKW